MTTKTTKHDAVHDALHELTEVVLDALSTLNFMMKSCRPSLMSQFAPMCVDKKANLDSALATVKKLKIPKQAGAMDAQTIKVKLEAVVKPLVSALDTVAQGSAETNEARGASQVLKGFMISVRSTEQLYSLVADLPEVDRFFISPGFKENADVLRRVHETSYDKQGTGLFNAHAKERGGYSIYVPEYYTGDVAWPMVIALHPGEEHGREFIWRWLREARTFGAVLLAPTSIGDSWSLGKDDADVANLARILREVRARWNLNPGKLLLTGTSDGGTYCYIIGLGKVSPFTHLAPCAANFHNKLVENASPDKLKGLPIYMVHGEQDWVFPLAVAKNAKVALSVAGARVTYRSIPNMAHAHPDNENINIMEWFLQNE